MSQVEAARSASRWHWFRSNLRVKLALGLALPLLIILSAIAWINYQRNQEMVAQQVSHVAEQFGAVSLSALRHGMVTNNPSYVRQSLDDLVSADNILQAQVFSLGGELAFASADPDVPAGLPEAEITCTVCHQYAAADRPRSLQFGEARGVVRVASPIANDPECRACHGDDADHLGMMLVDLSFAELDLQLQQNLSVNLAISGASALLVAGLVYGLSHRFVVRPLDQFRQPLAEFTSGEFEARIPDSDPDADEIGRLADAFNQMAASLQREQQADRARRKVRQQAILEERERIARELHDGVAQLLAYVNTKAIAARLRLADGNVSASIELLHQLEQASKDLLTDVREAILALKSAAGPGLVFPENLRGYIERFEDLSGLRVRADLNPEGLPATLPPELDLHLMRIVQEALANTRKHSGAATALVSIEMDNGDLLLTVEDSGRGFDPEAMQADGHGHFGLSTMRERARAIGADLDLRTEPGKGTTVRVLAPIGRKD